MCAERRWDARLTSLVRSSPRHQGRFIVETDTKQKIPRFIPLIKTTPTEQTDITGQDFRDSRTEPTPPVYSDRLHPPHNPSVVSSILTGATNSM